MAEFAKMVRDDYGLKCKPITTRNPQANSIIDAEHQAKLKKLLDEFNAEHNLAA